jgi:cytochrome c peroxidase
MINRAVVVVVTVAALATGCKKFGVKRCADDDCFFTPAEWRLVASLANVSREPPPADPSNRYLPTAEWTSVEQEGATIDSMPPVVRLGWRLYHDPRFSGDVFDPKDSLGRAALQPRPSPCGALVGVSCASCHDPAAHGGDVTSVPPNVSNGAGWYDVNSQQTLNAARFHPFFYWNGRTTTLWAQAAQVMESGVSMKGHRLRTLFIVGTHYLDAEGYPSVFDEPPEADIQRLAAGLSFTMTTAQFKNVYATSPKSDQAAASLVHVNVAKAIAAYEWFLRSDGAPFDRFVNEGASSGVLSPSQKRGLKLFIGHAGCVNCHNTPLFSDGRFHDIGVPQAGANVPTVAACEGAPNAPSCDCGGGGGDKSCLPSGAHGGVQKRKGAEFGACSSFDDGQADGGEAPTCAEDTPPPWGTWRTPSLRDVAMTGPYMHDGVFASLADVVWHYDQGGGAEGDGGSELAPLNLSDQDRADLVAFLESLTGTPGPKALVTAPPVPAGGYMVCPDGGAASDAGADGGADGRGEDAAVDEGDADDAAAGGG